MENFLQYGHAGVMQLNNGRQANYGVIRIENQHTNEPKLIYFTGKGLREMYKPNMTPDEKKIADELKKQNEEFLIAHQYIALTLMSEISVFLS